MQQLLKIKATALICQRILNAIHIKLVLDEIQAESGPAIAPIRDQNDTAQHGVGLLQIIPGTFSDNISESDKPHPLKFTPENNQRPYALGGTLPARTPQLDRDINEPWGNITLDDINRCIERFTKKERTMSERKYRLTDETITVFGRTLYRIQATESIPSRYVDEGEFGGFIEKEANLFGDAWVSGDARVYGDARVFGDAWVSGDAWVYQKQHVFVAGPAGVESRLVTAANTGTDEIFVRIGCWEGTLTTMMQAVAERRANYWGRHDEATQERWQAEYQAIHDMIAIRAESWQPEKEGKGEAHDSDDNDRA